MPFTFVEIEGRKTRTLALLFLLLILLYVASTAAVALILDLWMPHLIGRSMPTILTILGCSVVLACVHWLVSTRDLVGRVLTTLGARFAEPDDTYHARLRHIVEEVAVATGGRQRIEAHVIPATAMNACAVADFSGRCVIAVTEGLLARLTRSQLEAVIGHEAAHLARGDSLSTSVLCGLFGLHEEALRRLLALLEHGGGRIRDPRALALLCLAVVVLWVTNLAKRFCELCISRQQEYRADAVAVRLTRDPIALAEALRLIEKRWRGIGLAVESLETIFIVEPGGNTLAEREGVFAELFSTHPPTAKRIQALLGMAHLSRDAFERDLDARLAGKRRHMVPLEDTAPPAPARWYVRSGEEWLGPLPLPQIAVLPAFASESWVRREGERAVIPAYQDPALLESIRRRYPSEGGETQRSVHECPNCRVPLARIQYEGVAIERCPACGGCYMKPDQLQRILVREEYDVPESVKRLARYLPDVRGAERVVKRFDAMKCHWLKDRQCPECGGGVARRFYTPAYLVEVERCMLCGLTWLDRGELELLQCLYEEGARGG